MLLLKSVTPSAWVLLAFSSQKGIALCFRTLARSRQHTSRTAQTNVHQVHSAYMTFLPLALRLTLPGAVAAWALVLPCCIHIQVSYPFFFFYLASSSKKRWGQDPEKSTRHFGDWFPVPDPSYPAVTSFEGTFLLAPTHNNLPLLSTRYCISSSDACFGT